MPTPICAYELTLYSKLWTQLRGPQFQNWLCCSTAVSLGKSYLPGPQALHLQKEHENACPTYLTVPAKMKEEMAKAVQHYVSQVPLSCRLTEGAGDRDQSRHLAKPKATGASGPGWVIT